MRRELQALVDGALGGAIGTATMSATMVAAEKLGLLGEHPPELITAQALDAIGHHRRAEATQDVLAILAHLGFGVGAGALFALGHRWLRLPIAPTVQGIIFGSLVWAVSYYGWVPALGLMRPPERDRAGRPAAMLVAHWVFGWTLGAITGRR